MIYHIQIITLLVITLITSVAFAKKESLRIGSYNLKNYLIMNRLVEGVYKKDYPKPEIEKAALRSIITSHDIDILTVQEIGGEKFLKELQNDLKKEGSDYPFSAIIKGLDPVRQVAILSKVPFKKIHQHNQLSFKYYKQHNAVQRGLLQADFSYNKHDFSIFVVHLKSHLSQNPKDPESKQLRYMEVTKIQQFIKNFSLKTPSSLYLLTGDFNDPIKSKTLNRLQKVNKLEISKRLESYDSRNEVWTYYYKKIGQYSTFDHILVSPNAYTRIVNKKAQIVDSENSLIASDHRLIYTDISLSNKD